MGMSLDMVLVDREVFVELEKSKRLGSLWSLRFCWSILSDADQVSDLVVDQCRFSLAKILDTSEMKSEWPLIKALLLNHQVPRAYYALDHQRIEEFFGREPERQRREMLMAAIHGRRELNDPVECSYGVCRYSTPEDSQILAELLNEIDRSDLQSWVETPPQAREAELNDLQQKFAEAFGLSGRGEFSTEFLQAFNTVRDRREGYEATQYDLDTIHALAKIHTRCVREDAVVIHGIS